MAFTPNTKLYLGSVPFDPSYTHVVYIADREQQRAQIAARCTFGVNREDYTYQRPNNTVKVPYNAEQLYGLNYCMFQNTNYGNRWFYAFITNIEYVSEDTSRLWLQDDVFQTWFPDASVQTSYVEREHVNDDAIGAHLKDEGLSCGEMKVQYATLDNDETELYLVAASAVDPKKDGTYSNNGGDVYMNMYSGTSLTVFGTVEAFSNFMTALSNNGQQDAVSAVYMVPRYALGEVTGKSDGYGWWVNGNQKTPSKTLDYKLGFTTLDGYKPKNNKMYCYPFEYVELTNFMGENQKLRLEFFGSDGAVHLERTGGADVNSKCMYIPKNYNGITRATELALNMPQYPSVNWVYQTWANNYGASKFTYYVPFSDQEIQANSLVDLPTWNYVGNATSQTAELMGQTLSTITQALSQSKSAAGMRDVVGSSGALMASAVRNTADTYLGSAQIQADLAKQVRQPNTSRGGTNSSTCLANIGSFTMGLRKYTCRAEFAKMCDDYLSAFGYNVSEFKHPNLTGRASWNYVKTIGMQLHGKIPSDAMQSLQNMFDRGITLWHTWDVGNYGLDNSIV